MIRTLIMAIVLRSRFTAKLRASMPYTFDPKLAAVERCCAEDAAAE